MSYLTISKCVEDVNMQHRVRACWSQEGGDPGGLPYEVLWSVAGAQDIEAAYASALAAENPAPGADEAVITDQMILSIVQPQVPTPET